MRPLVTALLLLALVSGGCATAPAPVSEAHPPAPVTEAPPPAPAPAAGVTREVIPGGFRFGPLVGANTPVWQGSERLTVQYLDREAEVRLPAGEITVRTAATAGIVRNENVSPDQTRLVSYSKAGAGQWTDLTTGESHKVEGPGYPGSSVFDSWAPDSSLYLVQAFRDNPVPGFHFYGRDGRPAWTWQEPGYLSDWAVWSPDARQIAFLSTPLDLKYKMPPDAWDEPPMAPRLGVLDLATRKARYYQLNGQVAAGKPHWSPDGKQIALGFGPLQDRAGYPDVLRGRTYVVDAASGALRPVTGELKEDAHLEVKAWSPDSTGLLIYDMGLQVRDDGSADIRYQRHLVVSAGGGAPAILPAYARWVDGTRLIVADTNSVLSLVDRQGQQLQALGFGNWAVVSPDGKYAAFIDKEYLSVMTLAPPTAALRPSPPPSGVKVWAVDTAGQQAAELLFSRSEPLLLEGISPGGRYWLFEKVLGQAPGDPRGFSFLLDRKSGALTEGPQLDMHPDRVAWSGRGFWVGDLLHLGLDLRMEEYADLRKAADLRPGRRLLAASFTVDGTRVALVIDNEDLHASEARADLLWAEAGGKILARADHSVQPLGYFGKSGPFVYLAAAPGGDRAVLMSQSPGIALIDTGALSPGEWRPLLQPFVPPVSFAQSTGGPAGRSNHSTYLL